MITEQQLIQEIQGTTLRIRSGDGYKNVNLKQIFDIDQDRLTEEFAQQASLYVYFATLMAKAERLANTAEHDKDSEYALADLAYREEAEQNGRKTTEAQVKSMIVADQGYHNMVDQQIAMQYDFRLLKSIVTALEMRAEMLISLGAQVRNELSMTGMNMKEASYQKQIDNVKATISERRKISAHGQV